MVDRVKASATDELCSTQFERDLSNGSRKTREKIDFRSEARFARIALPRCPRMEARVPSAFPLRARCADLRLLRPPRVGAGKSAARPECLLRQRRMPCNMDYAGAQNITVDGKVHGDRSPGGERQRTASPISTSKSSMRATRRARRWRFAFRCRSEPCTPRSRSEPASARLK